MEKEVKETFMIELTTHPQAREYRFIKLYLVSETAQDAQQDMAMAALCAGMFARGYIRTMYVGPMSGKDGDDEGRGYYANLIWITGAVDAYCMAAMRSASQVLLDNGYERLEGGWPPETAAEASISDRLNYGVDS